MSLPGYDCNYQADHCSTAYHRSVTELAQWWKQWLTVSRLGLQCTVTGFGMTLHTTWRLTASSGWHRQDLQVSGTHMLFSRWQPVQTELGTANMRGLGCSLRHTGPQELCPFTDPWELKMTAGPVENMAQPRGDLPFTATSSGSRGREGTDYTDLKLLWKEVSQTQDTQKKKKPGCSSQSMAF